ncbi:MAG: hypothetical protein IJ209_05270 [Bacteroidaceae bacterium]|nr:hypothetical protein [Bacteroidaceae bacterium]
MAENKHYKPTYTPEEAEECFSWLEQHIDELPSALRLSPSINIPDVRSTVTTFIRKMRLQMGKKPIFAGQFAVLLMIREHAQGLLKPKE